MPTLRRRSDSPHDPAPSGQGSGPYRQRSNTTDKSSTSEGSQVSRVELREFRSITVEPSNAASSSPYRATESGPDSQQSALSLAFCFEGNQVKLGEINGLKGDNLRSQLMNDAGAAQKIIDCHIEKSSYEEGFCILTKPELAAAFADADRFNAR
ncbi:hypothetical protein CDV31_017335 [Fusarium ambrosium]|uniref:Uncharacterized protein n=1 Tax=Fusarium ambrosium TaxID=131363 RepID=A0A428RIC1_9HYPO|nr:hypothetical protein CDV31_017335 [Fusarium ambrosium]